MPAHLGGDVAGGDEATWYPELWDWFVKSLGLRSVLDVGCGDGTAIDYFRRELDVHALGIDGVERSSPHIARWDFTNGPYPGPIEPFDLVWSCEFVEHVSERYLPNVLASFVRGKVVAMTHAFPGQLGHHHVNCQQPDYWVGAMAASGYELATGLTDRARELANANRSPWNHFVRSGLIFRKSL